MGRPRKEPPLKPAPTPPQPKKTARSAPGARRLVHRETISATIVDELPKAQEHELAAWCVEISNRIDRELVPRGETEAPDNHDLLKEKVAFYETLLVQLLRISQRTCTALGLPPDTSLDNLEARLREGVD